MPDFAEVGKVLPDDMDSNLDAEGVRATVASLLAGLCWRSVRALGVSVASIKAR